MKFASYGWLNKQRSSQVDLLATDWVIRKVKPERTSRRQMEEFFSLHIWQRLLESYRSEYRWVQILSPRPIAIELDKHAIYMSFLQWTEVHSLISGNLVSESGSNLPKSKVTEIRNQILIQVGALMKIMENEHISHGDFLPRHIIGNTQTLWVIDVENSWNYLWVNKVLEEQQKMTQLILNCAKWSIRFNQLLIDSLSSGWSIITPTERRLPDIITEVEKDLWFKSSKFIK